MSPHDPPPTSKRPATPTASFVIHLMAAVADAAAAAPLPIPTACSPRAAHIITRLWTCSQCKRAVPQGHPHSPPRRQPSALFQILVPKLSVISMIMACSSLCSQEGVGIRGSGLRRPARLQKRGSGQRGCHPAGDMAGHCPELVRQVVWRHAVREVPRQEEACARWHASGQTRCTTGRPPGCMHFSRQSTLPPTTLV